MRLRRRMRVVGLVGMREHPVGQRGLDRPADDVRRGDGRDPLAAIRARELDRELAGRQLGPEIMAASVSRIMCLVFSTTASGSAREPAALMYVLSVVMIGLTAPGFAAAAPSCAARATFGATTDAASTPPACLRRSRLFIVAPSS